MAKAKTKTAKPLPDRKKFGEKNYTKKSCSEKKSSAKSTAEAHRGGGKNKLARVLKDPATGRWCVFTRG